VSTSSQQGPSKKDTARKVSTLTSEVQKHALAFHLEASQRAVLIGARNYRDVVT
jgi:hypothetical protein